MSFVFESEEAQADYEFVLASAAPDTLVFSKERLSYGCWPAPSSREVPLDVPGKETDLKNAVDERSEKFAEEFLEILRGLQVFQFHDTSEEAKVRKTGSKTDNFCWQLS
jgi:hypothetical protein